jgi:protein-S-isoprenylcysteine O-methyltransferase Ste14
MENATQVAHRGASVSARRLIRRRWWEYLGNGVLFLYGLGFLIAMIADCWTHPGPSSLFMALYQGAVAWFALLRPMPQRSNVSFYDWAIAMLGSVAIVLLRPAPQIHDNLILQTLQVLGMCISLAGLISLNTSYGLVAANRGVKTGGIYKIIRHPIYAGYFLSFGAYVVQSPSLANFLIYLALLALGLMRIGAEERELLRDRSYAEYARWTPWRLVPYAY